MKERLITLSTALAALFAVVFLLSPPNPNKPLPVSLPTTEDRGSDGLKGLFTWLQRERLAVVSLRKRYTELGQDPSLPDKGNALVINMPTPREVRETEWKALSGWLEKGNSLIVLGAVYHHPAWATGDDCFCKVKEFLLRFGGWELDGEDVGKPKIKKAIKLQESLAAIQASVKEQMPQKHLLTPVATPLLLEGVQTLETQITLKLLKKQWTLKSVGTDNLALRLLRIAGQNTLVAWQMSMGKGQVVLILTPDLFTNSQLNRGDNARFLSNLARQLLAPKGHLLFDDYHFGLSELYDPDHFFKDERLHKTLLCLGLFWLCYVMGYTQRLAPVRLPVAKRTTRDFIDVMAGFFARRINKPLLAEALVKHLLVDIHKQRRLSNEAEAWQLLAQHGQITGEQLNLLKRAQSKQPVSLLRLSNTITYIRTVTL
jgi:hypothetical protein